MNIKSFCLQEGVYLSACKTDKFKSAMMTVSFAVPLEKSTASGYSLLTNLLSLSTGDYPTMQKFSIIKDELYALGLDAYVQRRGEILLITLEINTIADSFAFDGEKVLDKAVALLGGAIFRPCLENGIFPEVNVESEKKCLIEEIASAIENKPAFAMKRARQLMCEGEPFAVDAGGETELVSVLDGKELMDYYRNAVNEAPVFITYAGEAEADYVINCIKAHLPFTPRKRQLPSPVVHPKRENILRVRENIEMEQSVLILGFTVSMPESPRERAILSVYDEIFGGSPASKLFMNVREKEGLCYYCSSYPSGRKNVLFVSCGVEAGNEEKAAKAVYNEAEAMKNGLFTDSELENAKSSILRSIQSTGASLGSMTGYMLGQALLEDSVTIEENIKLISEVTREEVIALAKTVTPELEYILAKAL